ncbi:MAG: molybdopterin-guanine dinucleotide biosynthesis protein B [Desulfarculaceae bacterium]|jgi:molybdopterin-guanine dinucleotide biosynthesis protein MobB
MLPLIGFCGASDSGKTTLVCAVIQELCKKGLRVGAIKHHGHAGPVQTPAPVKDSQRLAQAGAERVILSHQGGILLSADSQDLDLHPMSLAARFCYDLDLILVEGYKTADIDKIEVVAPDKDPMLPPGGRLLALARRGGSGQEAGLPILDADQPAALCDFILDHMHLHQPAPNQVSLKVDGGELELNPFVARILDATLRALVKNLKGGANPGKVEIELG